MYRISTERHQKALEYALSIIENLFFYNNVRKDGKLLRLREKEEED